MSFKLKNVVIFLNIAIKINKYREHFDGNGIVFVNLFVCLPAPAWYMFPDAAPNTAHQPKCTACYHHMTQGNGKTLEDLTILP